MREPDFYVETTMNDVRRWLGSNDCSDKFGTDLIGALDEAQGNIHQDKYEIQTILIEIKRGSGE